MRLSSNGKEIDTSPEKFGLLRDANELLHNAVQMRERMQEDGYVYLRNFLDKQVVLEARREILLKYAIAGEIDAINHPLMDAIQAKNSFIDKINLIAFDESVRTGMAYEKMIMSENLQEFFKQYFACDQVVTFDFKWVRFLRQGEGCGFHCDSVYICRGTQKLFSCWIPIGDVSMEEGALMLLENTHKNEKLKQSYGSKDADKEKLGWLSTDPHALQKR